MITGMPGINGSLGCCAICGKDFLSEILTNRKVKTFAMDGFDMNLCAHAGCFKLLKDGMDWRTLPDGPLRKAYAEANQQANVAPAHQAEREGKGL